MRRKDEGKYTAKVTDDAGLTRGRVPCPLLSVMGARPGDYLTFRLSGSSEAVMRLTRSRSKASKGGKRKAVAGKRR
jgi:hypothetical protein